MEHLLNVAKRYCTPCLLYVSSRMFHPYWNITSEVPQIYTTRANLHHSWQVDSIFNCSSSTVTGTVIMMNIKKDIHVYMYNNYVTMWVKSSRVGRNNAKSTNIYIWLNIAVTLSIAWRCECIRISTSWSKFYHFFQCL